MSTSYRFFTIATGFVSFIAMPCLLCSTAKSQEKLAQKSRIQLPGLQNSGETLLPNGWSLRPAGEQIDVGDFPSRMEISPNGKYAALQHTGWGTHEIRIISLADRKIRSSVVIDQTFQGLRFSEDGSRLYVSGAEDEVVYVYDHREGYLTLNKKIQLADPKDKLVVAGITEAGGGKKLLACGLMAESIASDCRLGCSS